MNHPMLAAVTMKTPPLRCRWKKYTRTFRVPLRTATGVHAKREGILLKISGDDGAVGFGEIAPWPGFGGETLADAENFLRDAGEKFASDGWGVLGEPSLAKLPCTHAALTMAKCWSDGWKNLPEAAASLHSAALLPAGNAALETLPVMREKGFSVFKWKIGVTAAEEEICIAASLLKQLRGDEKLRLDANGALPSLAPWLAILGHPQLEFLEQPYSPERMAREKFADEIAKKIALDESVTTLASLPENWPGVTVVKPLLLGNWENFVTWRQRRTTPIIYSSVFETAVGREALLRLAISDKTAVTRAHGLGTLGAFLPDNYEAHGGQQVTVRPLNWSPAQWENWWDAITAEKF